MANNVRNQLQIYGDKRISQVIDEMISRLDKDNAATLADTGSVGRVLYGLSGNDAILGYDEIGAKWIYYDEGYWNQLVFTSGWSPARGLQDHIVEHLAKIDPHAFSVLEYDDEMPNFVGVRIAYWDGTTVKCLEREVDTRDTKIVDDDELDEALAELQADGEEAEYEAVKTWDDVWDEQRGCRNFLVERAKALFSWFPNDFA